MTGWDMNDLAALGPGARASALQQLKARADNDRRLARPTPPEVTATITLLEAKAAAPAAAPAPERNAAWYRRRRQALLAAQPTAMRRWEDIGDLYEPTTHAVQGPDTRTLVIVEPVPKVNELAGRGPHVIAKVEDRWTDLVLDLCEASALQPMAGAVHLSVWHLMERGGRRQLRDVDAAHFPIKGAVDGLVLAGIIPDDGPGYVRTSTLVECVYTDVTGLVFHLARATRRPTQPFVTVPHTPEPKPARRR